LSEARLGAAELIQSRLEALSALANVALHDRKFFRIRRILPRGFSKGVWQRFSLRPGFLRLRSGR
jgi:hypothetical protein